MTQDEQKKSPGERNARLGMIIIVLAMAGASIYYRFLVHHQLEQTAALFIGLPSLIAIGLLLLPKRKTSTGIMLIGVTIFMLISMMFLGEGSICVLMASPIFFGVALIIGLIDDRNSRRRRNDPPGPRTGAAFAALLLFLPMSFEGVRPGLSFNRAETVVVVKEYSLTVAQVITHLNGAARFDRPLPYYLRLGFPKATAMTGAGLQPGDQRRIHFAGGEGHPGDLVMTITAADANSVRLQTDSDSSHIAHWLKWQDATLRWQALDNGKTRVEWTMRYERSLDPAWYFAPWERYAVGQSGGYFMDSLLQEPAP